ncbi:MAG: hypothetical protein RSC10_01610 [Longicatena sp.]
MIKNKKGAALIWAIAIIMVLSVVVAASLSVAYSYYHRSLITNSKRQAYLTSKGVIENIVEKVVNNDETYISMLGLDKFDDMKEGSSVNLNIDLPGDAKLGAIKKATLTKNPKEETRGKITFCTVATYAQQDNCIKADMQLKKKSATEQPTWQLLRYYNCDDERIVENNITTADNLYSNIFEFGNKRSEAVESGNNKLFENYLKSYGESHGYIEKIKEHWGGSNKFWFSNDKLRLLLIDIMYNGTWTEFKNSEANLPEALKNMKLYIQPYLTTSGGNSIVYACEANDESKVGRWAAKLIFNPKDGHWYDVTNEKATGAMMTEFSITTKIDEKTQVSDKAALEAEKEFYEKFAKEYFIPDNIVQ